MSDSLHRSWCFTLFGLTKENWKESISAVPVNVTCAFLVCQLESTQAERLHVQGYVYFKNARSMAAVKKDFGGLLPHLEPAKGSVEDNVKYCTKLESRVEGTHPKWFCRTRAMVYYIELFDFSLFTCPCGCIEIPLTI